MNLFKPTILPLYKIKQTHDGDVSNIHVVLVHLR
jgi:hypothetical protein